MGFFDIFKRNNDNKFNQAFYKFIGSEGTNYDDNGDTYLNEGFNKNPIVYSIISQMATKSSSVPFSVRKIEDKASKLKRDNLIKATNYNFSPQQKAKEQLLKEVSFSDELGLPLDKPNSTQSWIQFIELYKTLIKLNGNVYIYKLRLSEGRNAGKIIALYLLPSNKMNILLKSDADMLSLESPIKGYKLIDGNQYITFTNEEISHIKYPNPNFDMDGSHLYGVAPTKAILRNLKSTNLALDLNIKTMKNGGAFGLIHSKGQTPLTEPQAKGLKDRLIEMDNSTDKLAKIAGVSAEIGFTRLSMTTDELKLFDFLNYDQKQICNVFGWSDKLLNNDSGAKYDNVNQYRKQVVTDNIIPDLKLLEEVFNNDILPYFKGYENSCLIFEFNDLPEMQEDISKLVGWGLPLKQNGVITANQLRDYIGLGVIENDLLDEYTTDTDTMTLEQALEDIPTITND